MLMWSNRGVLWVHDGGEWRMESDREYVVHAAIPGNIYIVKWLMLLKSDTTQIMLVTILLLSGQQHTAREYICV